MNSKNKNLTTPYERARKRVDDLKGFYGHLTAYILVNSMLLLGRDDFSFYVLGNSAFGNSDFLNWINWNVYGTPIIWGVFLVFHALSVFGRNPFLGKAWEERQIEKYMNEE